MLVVIALILFVVAGSIQVLHTLAHSKKSTTVVDLVLRIEPRSRVVLRGG